MKIHSVVQGTPEWLACRLGIPTCSAFSKIITPKTLKPSTSQAGYVAKLTAEWYLGRTLDEAESGFMERGTEMEAEAVAAYEFEKNVDTQVVGFITTDDGRVGGSPDRLVGEDGGLEIKCPSAEVHVGYLLNGVDAEYRCQIQGLLWLTGRKWWDLRSFNPAFDAFDIRFEPDAEFIGALDAEMPVFLARLDAAKIKLAPAKARRDESLRAAIENGEHPF